MDSLFNALGFYRVETKGIGMNEDLRSICCCDVEFQVLEALQCDAGVVEKTHCECRVIAGGYEIEVGKMYDAPANVSFENLVKLSQLFGTEKIDVDDYANSGCESCDYGSDYGHTIQIYNPTKMLAELKEWSEA